MKKVTVIFLTLLFVISLAACGSKSQDMESKQKSEKEATETKAQTKKPETSFESFDAVNNDECRITIKELDPDGFWGYGINVELENKSPSVTYRFVVRSATVNGMMADPLFSASVAPGKKSNESIDFMASSLEDAGIEEYTDIGISFDVYDDDDWMAEHVAEETVHIYPYGEEKATKYVYERKADDIILADNDSITAIITGFEEDSIWGYSAKIYLENKTDVKLMFSVDDCSVNGYMLEPFWATSVLPGATSFSSMSWSKSDFEENGIENVDEIEFFFKAHDYDDWTAESVFGDTIVVHP